MSSGTESLWSGSELDLDGYLTRIGHQRRDPSTATLRALHRAHVTAIPFENLDIVAGRPVGLDLASVQDKLVRRRRGGYCYEHVVLFAAALERLGFGVTGLHGRVTSDALRLLGLRSSTARRRGPVRVVDRPATHALLRVTTADDETPCLCDVGFGGGPLYPIELVAGGKWDQQGWQFALEREVGETGVGIWWLRQHAPEGWLDRYAFTLNPQYPVDYGVGHHFLSTHSSSVFRRRPFAQRFHPDRHEVLHGTSRFTAHADGTSHETTLRSDEVPGVLRAEFGIDVDPDVDVPGLD
ncbi:arylamine N-acetyltransferase family protein [Actinopolyspora mortivallis]|uniref:Acetyltransferase n=1 Tax=Actinopolyspora mortivallis TaxID=33906 RepID=A0A2T0GXK4_ACTMO|nr:arylamine N-acetyltransferase [Actinopolyspora mortivallis]PRW63838.1 acetyltransferase [Actinopolyspora mortivallis]